MNPVTQPSEELFDQQLEAILWFQDSHSDFSLGVGGLSRLVREEGFSHVLLLNLVATERWVGR